MKKVFAGLAMLGMLMGYSAVVSTAQADDTVGEKTEEAMKDTGRGAKKAGRAVKDKGCELVNGKNGLRR